MKILPITPETPFRWITISFCMQFGMKYVLLVQEPVDSTLDGRAPIVLVTGSYQFSVNVVHAKVLVRK